MTAGLIGPELRQRIAEELAGQFKGEVIGPDHGEYPEARQVWNAMADRRPGLILRCAAAADVVAAVNVAREHGLPHRSAAAAITSPARACPTAA